MLKEIISLNKFSILNNEQIKNIFEIVKLEINEFKNINAEKENETSSESGQIKKKKGKLLWIERGEGERTVRHTH